MLAAFARLDVPLQRVVQPVQQLGDDRVADRMAKTLQRGRQGANACAGPPQRRVRIAGRRRLHQRIEVPQQGSVEGGRRFPTAARLAAPSRRERRLRLEFAQAALDRGSRDPGGPFDLADAPVPERARLGGRPNPTRALGEDGRQRRMFRAERRKPHASRYHAPYASTSEINQLFPDRLLCGRPSVDPLPSSPN